MKLNSHLSYAMDGNISASSTFVTTPSISWSKLPQRQAFLKRQLSSLIPNMALSCILPLSTSQLWAKDSSFGTLWLSGKTLYRHSQSMAGFLWAHLGDSRRRSKALNRPYSRKKTSNRVLNKSWKRKKTNKPSYYSNSKSTKQSFKGKQLYWTKFQIKSICEPFLRFIAKEHLGSKFG